MQSISDKAKSIFAGLAVKSRTLWSSLTGFNKYIPSLIRSSQKKLRIEATKEYFRKHSSRRNSIREEKKPNNLKEKVPGMLQALNEMRPGLRVRGTLDTLFAGISWDTRWKKSFAGLVAAICLVAITGAGIATSTEKAYAVKVDGKQVALVHDKAAAERVLERIKQEKAAQWKQKLMVNEKIAYTEAEAKKYQVLDNDDLEKVLSENLTFVGVATGIKADGKLLAAVKDTEAANQVLEALKNKFTGNLNNMKAETVAFKEKVEIIETPANLSSIMETDQVIERLLNGEEKAQVHVVKEGDSLWTIARKHDTRVANLKAANPQLKGDNPKLDIGQEIKLVKVEPLLTVLVTAQATVKENIPYKVKVNTDKTMWKGKQQIKEKGENGSREVTYKLVFANGAEAERKVLQEKVLKPAKDQVVVRGAKLVVASRGGNGKLAWPTNGRITSRFGRRWGSMHTGLDIDGRTGQPIGAADDGKVVSTGWDGGYGKQVTIDHGNGTRTKYAHLSSINVSVGEKVSRGELIGKMGNTGRSTGSHLHFEVIVGGSFRNPLSYLK